MREFVDSARKKQDTRFNGSKVVTNGRMTSRQVRQHCKLDEPCSGMLKQAYTELGLSARAHDKICKIARTIADIENEEHIQTHHIAEAIQYRRLDRYF
jgi:magnesium chelatase family protein